MIKKKNKIIENRIVSTQRCFIFFQWNTIKWNIPFLLQSNSVLYKKKNNKKNFDMFFCTQYWYELLYIPNKSLRTNETLTSISIWFFLI